MLICLMFLWQLFQLKYHPPLSRTAGLLLRAPPLPRPPTFSNKLALYPVPRNLDKWVCSGSCREQAPPLLYQPLTRHNYVHKLGLLLHLEEIKLNIDIMKVTDINCILSSPFSFD